MILIDRGKDSHDSNLIRDAVLPKIRHLELQTKQVLIVFDVLGFFRDGLTVIGRIIDVERHPFIFPFDNWSVDDRTVAFTDRIGMDKGKMNDIELIFDRSGVMDIPALRGFHR
jgi:hypothetical protein